MKPFLDKKFINAVGLKFVLTNLVMEGFVVLCNEIGSNILKGKMNLLFNPNRATKNCVKNIFFMLHCDFLLRVRCCRESDIYVGLTLLVEGTV